MLDIVGERRDPGLGFDRAGAGVKRRHRAPERVGQRRIDLARRRQPVERRILVEAVHFDCPLHRRAGAIELEGAVRLARDPHHAAVDLGRERPIDPKLRFAGAFALGEGRIVQKGKAHRALDLEHALGREEQHGRMRVDALDLVPAVGRGVGEEREHRLLLLDDVVHQ